ncbi:TPA: hypothetical protein R1962_002324 [Staphylococcus delphini]|nr:hypothetical protein [Staphylococcus delphini]
MGEIRNNMIDVILEKHGITDKNVSSAVKEIAYALSKESLLNSVPFRRGF